MSIIADQHIHSSFSGDSETPMEQEILAAIAAGITYLCFTEHYDPEYPYDYAPDIPFGFFEVDERAYHKEWCRMRDLYEEQITLGYGIELGLQAHLGSFLHDYMQDKSFDFVIGSSHVAGGFDTYYPHIYEGRTEEEGIRLYFTESLANIRSFHDFDTYGHLDYNVRYVPSGRDFCAAQYEDVITPILEALLQYDIALEVNTSAMKSVTDFMHMNPHPDILRKYLSMGGRRITVGSDAHRPERVGYGFEPLSAFLKELGFTHYEVFRGRKAEAIPL